MAELNKTRSGKRRILASIVAGMTIAGCGAALLWQPDEHEPAAASVSSAPRDVRFGPGLWTAEAAVARHPDLALQPPQQPNVAADGKLIIDRTLHQVIDFFLLGGLPGSRALHADQLRAYLGRVLPPVAEREALQIVDRYLLYMNLHDDLLTRQALPQWVDTPSPADAERVTNWILQRTRLRQTILGNEIMQAWYADEEAAIRAGFAEFEAHSSAAIQVPDAARQSENEAGVIPDTPRLTESSREARREQFLRRLTEQSSKSYVVLERERQLNAVRNRDSAS